MPAVPDTRNVSFDEIPDADSRRVEWMPYRRAVGWAPEAPDNGPGNPVAISSIDFVMPPGEISRDGGLPEP